MVGGGPAEAERLLNVADADVLPGGTAASIGGREAVRRPQAVRAPQRLEHLHRPIESQVWKGLLTEKNGNALS